MPSEEEPLGTPGLSKGTLGPVPRKEFGDQDATTRKVANLQETPVTPVQTAAPRVLAFFRRVQIWHAVVVSAAIAGGVVLATMLRESPSTPSKATSTPALVVPVVLPAKLEAAPELPAPPQPAQSLPRPKTIRLEVGVEPAAATLTLDGASVGHQLAVDAPEDQSVHVLKASAPGFLAFSQKIKYSRDVRLVLQLRPLRAPARGPAKPHIGKLAAKPQTLVLEARPTDDVRPAPAPVRTDVNPPAALPQITEPGMNLGHPSKQRTAKPIDEKDPYAQ